MPQKAAYFLTLGKLSKLMGDLFAFRFDLRIGEPPPFFQSLNEEQIMRIFYRIVLTATMFLFCSISWADPVPIDCPPRCTVDPCVIAPERCKDKGGPLNKTAVSPTDNKKNTKVQDSEEPCKWCEPCSKTPGSQCLKCCARHSKTPRSKLMR